MKAKIIISGLAVLLIAGGIVIAQHQIHKDANKLEAETPPPTAMPRNTPSVSPSPSSNASSSVTNITLSANDSGASQTTITVSRGMKVNLTFKVDSQGVYHGGLYFKSTDSSVQSVGPIKPGDQGTVSFVAANSFSFVPYWYAENVQKGYNITVNVQ